ncbi:MAG: hypothetical protein OET81_05140 [Desulfobacteraceae bacterium]|nr:hypothetical protein [Desulfobacteraceae bacterium]MDH3573618.1 hypothetical protein [Desulfobacteraceae bacterium]MDH3721177.1 hypothetical protein [Desulfobacteraceae bacterium]MDH3836835.1 hypothetical protein [Desulfobacteraceae bacterium]MDH3873797.1 hypothetical protein [Desulfobacteraceae bacterium]
MTIRDIERRKVCYDDNDRDNFLDRLMERDRVEMGSNLNSNQIFLNIFQQVKTGFTLQLVGYAEGRNCLDVRGLFNLKHC